MRVARKGLEGFHDYVVLIEPRLISYLRYASGSSTDAEDLFQDVCIKLHRDWDTVSQMERPDSWVFRVAHNLVVNRFRRKDVERRGLKLVSKDEVTHDGPDNSAGDEEVGQAVQKALSTLPDDQREAVCQKIWGESSWVEIGKALGVSDDTAARLFARGINAITPLLKGFDLTGN